MNTPYTVMYKQDTNELFKKGIFQIKMALIETKAKKIGRLINQSTESLCFDNSLSKECFD